MDDINFREHLRPITLQGCCVGLFLILILMFPACGVSLNDGAGGVDAIDSASDSVGGSSGAAGSGTGGTGGPTGAGDLCTDTCPYNHDNFCDDGGPLSLTGNCALGTDCADCGTRTP
jgi:hypothetical protein